MCLSSKKFLGKVLAKKSKILAGGQDLARRLRSCHILGKILAKILARNWPAIILAPWARSWASLGQVGQVGQDLGQESCPRTFCWVWPSPRKTFLNMIPAHDLDQLPKTCPRCQDYAGQVLAKILPKIYGKISASWQYLGLLPRSCSSWQESCPRTFCWVLEEKSPPSCRKAGANSGGVGHCSPKMVLVQVATVVAIIVMVFWYQSSPIQYYWYYTLPLVCWSYVWVGEVTVHLVGVVVGLEALVMSFFYREVLSAVLVVVSILQSVFGVHE